MSTTADRASATLDPDAPARLAPAEGLELLGEVSGSGYQQGASLVRRADGQMVQLGPLQYALLEELDGERDPAELSEALCAKLGRDCDERHVAAIAQKLAEQGLLAGSESQAPPRSNPLLALRWKVVVTNPELTRRLTAPFISLFRPWLLVPVLVAFAAAAWFVLLQQGVASGAASAFARPELILLLFALGIASAGFHELGHATACRYGGGTPGAMGAGIYLVWPAFYTDVTDSYRLPRRARLRTDLGGLYFNAIVAVATISAWLLLREDALLLLIGLQLLEMVKQLSPVIRADGYHILSDLTGVPDLYAHIGPTLRQLVPGRAREASALTGRARIIVTAWVLVVVPILLGVAFSAVLLLPKLAASTWESGSQVLAAMSAQASDGGFVGVLVGLLRLLGLALPVAGMALIVHRLTRAIVGRAAAWSRGRAGRRAFVVTAAAGVAALLLWAWWPDGQYEPIKASDGGRISQVGQLVATQPAASRTVAGTAAVPAATDQTEEPAPVEVPPGTHVAISLVPEGGATEQDPAIFVITDPSDGALPIVLTATSTPEGDDASSASEQPATTSVTAFAFDLPDAPEADDSQALAVNRTDGSVVYEIAYSLVTVRDGEDVDQRNGAHAYANCSACTTVAVSFQVVLVVGSSPLVAPVNIAEALNGNCPSCVTAAIANQIVVSVGEEPSEELLAQLSAELERLDGIDELGSDATPAEISAQVTDVQRSINQLLADSGQVVGTQEEGEEGTSTPEEDAASAEVADAAAEPDADADAEDAAIEGDAETETAPETAPDSGAEPTDPDGTSDTDASTS